MNEELEAVEKYIDMIIELGVKYGFQVLAAIIILIIGLIVARWLSNMIVRLCDKRKLDITLSRFQRKYWDALLGANETVFSNLI